MRTRYRFAGMAASALTFIASALSAHGGDKPTAKPTWPELYTIGAVSGRPATTEDIEQGHAAFIINAEDGVSAGTPLDIVIPQYAWHVDEEAGTRAPVVLIQAEVAQGRKIAGYLSVVSGDLGISLLSELELLGIKVLE